MALVIEMSAEEAKLWQSITSTVSKMATMERGLAKITEESKKSARAQAELGREAHKVLEGLQTPMDRHNQKLQRLQQLYEAGKLSVGQFARAKHQEIEAYRKSEEAARKATDATEKSFGAGALAKLTTYVGGLVSISAGVQQVTRALDDMQRVRQEAGQAQRTARIPLSQLAQISETPEEMKANVAKAKELYSSGGAASLEEAASIIFDVTSTGQGDQYEFIKQLRRKGFVKDTGEMTKSVVQLQTAMGKGETGSFRELVNKAVLAAAPSPEGPEAILSAAAEAGVSAKMSKTSDEELLAAMGIVAMTTNAQEAATQVNRLLMELSSMGAPKSPRERMLAIASGKPDLTFDFEGKTLAQKLEMIKAKNLNEDQLQKLLGDVRGVKAFGVLMQNKDAYEKLRTQITEGQAKDVVGKRMEFPGMLPEIAAGQQADEAAAAEMMSRGQLGTWDSRANAIRDIATARMRQAGESESWIWFRQKEFDISRWMGGDEKTVTGLGAAGVGAEMKGQEAGYFEQAAAEMLKAAKMMQDAAQQSGRNRNVSTSGATNVHSE